ncbi:MAG TPA: hypothetical protein VKT83_08580 [bacterium]|nr:hypothetical protein [bacterium]
MTRSRRRAAPKKRRARPAPRAKRATTPKAASPPKPVAHDSPGPGKPTLRSQAQVEVRLERGARALTATEQAARLASAQMERRIGRLLSRRVKLKFR